MELPEATVALERLVKSGRSEFDVVQQFLRTVVVVPVVAPADGDSAGLAPLMSHHDGADVVLAFTTAEGAQEVADRTPYVLTVSGTSLILRLPDGIGIALFATEGNVSLAPALLREIRRDIASQADGSGTAL